jgi:hypothetical protein
MTEPMKKDLTMIGFSASVAFVYLLVVGVVLCPRATTRILTCLWS